VINLYLIEQRVLDLTTNPTIGLMAETGCSYFASISFPDLVRAGLRVARIGQSSARYEVGLFANDDDAAAAQGHFVHVYVDRATRRPRALPDDLRPVLEAISVD
jgi:acyl-CoA thioester hydrolase